VARRNNYSDGDSESDSNSRTISRQHKACGKSSSKHNSDDARRAKMAYAKEASKPIYTDSESSTSNESEDDYLVSKSKRRVKTKWRKACKPTCTDPESSSSSSSSSSSEDESEYDRPIRRSRERTEAKAKKPGKPAYTNSESGTSDDDSEYESSSRKSNKKVKKMKAKTKAKKMEAKKMEAKKKAVFLDSETSDSSDSGMNSIRKMQKLLVKANESVRTVASSSSNAINSLPDTGVDNDLVGPTTQSSIRQPEPMRRDSTGAAHAAGGNAKGNNEASQRATITVNGTGKVMAITPPAIDPDLSETTISRNQR
jgi:hypothetical protein